MTFLLGFETLARNLSGGHSCAAKESFWCGPYHTNSQKIPHLLVTGSSPIS
ncbi:hypothetical protein THTE_1517 [Thermogutta terrifontis]|uniref:Uncharacterized protein n=1 Tax=Thermogutta terrifontis TaxID=1331910 RepID=A0A286RDT1_9BACT|nr:hypothetical protein THTE_1517 [Thermogutta terrifontis]